MFWCAAHGNAQCSDEQRATHRLFLGLGPSENGDDLGILAQHLEEFPAALAHVGPPGDELLPLRRRGTEDPEIGDVLPLGRIGCGRPAGHRGGSGETISRVLFTRWYEQMVISLG